jgi:hypothetical protein
MKRFFSALILIAVVICLFFKGQVIAGANTFASAPSMQRGKVALRFALRQIREANKKLRYTIKARYPQALGAGRDPRLTKLNLELRKFIEKEVSGFKKDFGTPEVRTFGGENTFDSRYQVEFATDNLVSISFVINTYFEGAAHGNYNTIVFNYDLNSGKTLSLASLFKPNSNYLEIISGYAIKSLKKEMAPDAESDWIQSGAGPKEENYQSWNITGRGLEVNFDPYQVASYAEGPHMAVVPYAILKDVIDPNGPLSKIETNSRSLRK